MPGEVLCFQKCTALDEAKCLQLNLFSKCLEVVVCVILGLGLFSSTFFLGSVPMAMEKSGL